MSQEETKPLYRKIPGFRSGTPWKMIVASVIYVILINSFFNTDNTSDSYTSSSGKTSINIRENNQALEISNLNFFEIRDNANKMTDAQWEEYRKHIIGKRVRWDGYILEVKEDGKVMVDMDPPGSLLSVQDVYFYIPKEDALKYNKGQAVKFEGTIKNISKILGSLAIDFKDIIIFN